MQAMAILKVCNDVLLLSIAYKVSTKQNTEELSLMTLKKGPNFEEKLTFLFEK